MFQNRRMGPGAYHVDVGGFNKKTVEEKASGPGWSRAYEVERMAALPHLLHKEQWEMKKELVSVLYFNPKSLLANVNFTIIKAICCS